MVSAPKAPDPKETAAAQSGMNSDTAQTQQLTNMVNQNTPTGSLTYTQDGTNSFVNSSGKTVTVPKYTATTSLSPGQQQIFDATQGATQNLATTADQQSDFLKNYLSSKIDLSGAPALQTSIGNGFSGNVGGSFSDTVDPSYKTDIGNGYSTTLGGNYSTALGGNYSSDLGPDYVTTYGTNDDYSADRDKVVAALKARQQPDQDKATSDLETQLIGRGLRPGTAAWNSEMDRNSRAINDANMTAELAGGQEQSRLVGLDAARAAFTDQSLLNKGTFANGAELGKFTAQNAAELGKFTADNGAALDSANFTNNSTLQKMTAQNTAALSAADLRNTAATTSANFGNAARTQYNSEAYAERNQPIQEIAALLGGSQVQSPNFTSTPTANVGGVDYTGLVSDKYKADTAAYQSTMGGLFGLLSAPFSMFSFGA